MLRMLPAKNTKIGGRRMQCDCCFGGQPAQANTRTTVTPGTLRHSSLTPHEWHDRYSVLSVMRFATLLWKGLTPA